MHPALSVIFFTVTAGAGYGVMILLGIARISGLAPALSPGQVLVMGFVGLVLVTLGLLSSTLHLANPKNAWRSFARFKTSWLSREAVFAVLFYPLSLLWLLVVWTQGSDSVFGLWLGFATAVLAIVVLICTAMIYASLKTIRQWNNALTPVNFVLLGLLLGSLVLLLMLQHQSVAVSRLLSMSMVVMVVAALAKLVYFIWLGQPAGPTINTALGFTRATVRLLDVGHTSDTFLTKEFGFQVARVKIMWLRLACFVMAFALPLLMLVGVFGEPTLGLFVLALISGYTGVFVERWLFFAEARHVVNLYHGAQRT